MNMKEALDAQLKRQESGEVNKLGAILLAEVGDEVELHLLNGFANGSEYEVSKFTVSLGRLVEFASNDLQALLHTLFHTEEGRKSLDAARENFRKMKPKPKLQVVVDNE